ncbi:MAG: hypothetical protein AAFQ77_02975 [Myxococcota bacterium]
MLLVLVASIVAADTAPYRYSWETPIPVEFVASARKSIERRLKHADLNAETLNVDTAGVELALRPGFFDFLFKKKTPSALDLSTLLAPRGDLQFMRVVPVLEAPPSIPAFQETWRIGGKVLTHWVPQAAQPEVLCRWVSQTEASENARWLVGKERDHWVARAVRDSGLTGSDVAHATASFDEMSQPTVQVSFTRRGTTRFAELTAELVGGKLAIVVDGELVTAPVVQQAITGGQAQIAFGGMTGGRKSAEALAAAVSTSPLPSRLIPAPGLPRPKPAFANRCATVEP